MKKIVHLTSVHKRYDVRIFLKECITLVEAGYEVYLIVADGQGDEIKSGVNILDVGSSRGRLDRMWNTTRRIYVKALSIQADLYHFHDPELIPIGLKLKRHNSKVIFDSHENYADDLQDKQYINSFFRPIISRVYRWYESHSIKKIDSVIAATPSIRDYFLSKGVVSLDINNFPFESEFVTKKSDNKLYDAVYIGSISEVRGVRLLVESFSINNNLKLGLAGSFSDEEFSNNIKKSSGWPSVEFLGYLDRAGVADLLSKSKVAVVTFLPAPNHIESQPNKMFEYMSSGLPLVCSNFPLWREIVEGNDCGLCIDPSSKNEVASAIKYLVENPEVADRMGSNGRKAVLAKYNWAVESKKLVSFYKEIFSKND